ncbi:hypothetical protein LIER_21258 [Lithospermum erythrorhizon]|uniref:Transposase MuDR plant domain-containing protein n=1 Tax=Lithospermum erythrorhizon TaxID=34254 RepID=A0AAV3QT25_LITER
MSAEEDESEGEVCSSARPRKGIAGIEFNSEVHLKHPILIPNMVFVSAQDFRKLIREYIVQTKKPLEFVKNNKTRVRVKCLEEGCEFFVLCSRDGKSKDLSIKTLVGDHTCCTSMKILMVSVKWLARKAIKAAGYLIYGNENQQFARLWSYAKEMLDTIPGSIVITKLHEQKFERVYV